MQDIIDLSINVLSCPYTSVLRFWDPARSLTRAEAFQGAEIEDETEGEVNCDWLGEPTHFTMAPEAETRSDHGCFVFKLRQPTREKANRCREFYEEEALIKMETKLREILSTS